MCNSTGEDRDDICKVVEMVVNKTSNRFFI